MPFELLENLWKHALQPISVSEKNKYENWDEEIKTLYQLGISMEDAMQFLYHKRPDFETFKSWVNKKRKDQKATSNEIYNDVLSEKDLHFWNENGYIVIKNAISKQDCEDTQRAIWEFLNMDPHNNATWYIRHPEQKGLMLNFSDHETLNKNRFSPIIKKAFEQLYNSAKIYKTIDKVSFNPPENENFTFMGSPLHWDTSLKIPIPFSLQGLLYLTDCGPDDGAFHCVPGFHNQIENWLETLDPKENPRDFALKTLKPKPIIGDAGDFIIWNNTLPHCASPNKGKSPRIVQYLTYLPDDYNSSGEWI